MDRKRVTALVIKVEIEVTDANGKVVRRIMTDALPIFEADLGPDLYDRIMAQVQPLVAEDGGQDGEDTPSTGELAARP